MRDAKDYYKCDPHPCFASLDPFEIEHHDQSDEWGRSIHLTVRDATAIIAAADFTATNSLAWPQNVNVAEPYRRRGIASALYRLAENIFGKVLVDRWHEQRSDDAKKLWANPNRPFGFPRAIGSEGT